jgi:hypothetical protein
LSVVVSGEVVASQERASIDKVVDSVKSVCLAPSERGKYWEVQGTGKAEAKVNIKVLSKLGVEGTATFSEGEWEGVQRVLREKQADENARYRTCVEKLTPLFLDKFVPRSSRLVDPTPLLAELQWNHDTIRQLEVLISQQETLIEKQQSAIARGEGTAAARRDASAAIVMAKEAIVKARERIGQLRHRNGEISSILAENK